MCEFEVRGLFDDLDPGFSIAPLHDFRHQEVESITPDLDAYDRICCFFSGGKDSVACVLHLLSLGVDPKKIELHHHDVDGDDSTLMDWPVTRSYVKAFAKSFGLRLFFSWKKGGFEGEMLRENQRTAPIVWERPDGSVVESGGDGGKESTRRKFPQVTADLSRRYCSAYLKIDVGARILTNDARFRDGKTLVITGERAEESASRARYRSFEPHRTDRRSGKQVQRWVDHWRPVHAWSEAQVWEILKAYRVNPHPAYWLGWGRTSCMKCIFGSANQWASIRLIDPLGFERIAQYEEEFGYTIHRTLSVRQLADRGVPYTMDPSMVALAMARDYPESLIRVADEWRYPAGAFGESNGPS